MPGDETGGLRCEEDRSPGELLRLAKTAHRRPHQQLPPAISAVEKSFIQRGAKYARQDRIHTYAVWSPLHSQRLGECGDAGFARSIRRHFVERNERCERSNVDDPAIALLDHVRTDRKSVV